MDEGIPGLNFEWASLHPAMICASLAASTKHEWISALQPNDLLCLPALSFSIINA